MNIKKITASLLAGAMTLSLCACSKQDTQSQPSPQDDPTYAALNDYTNQLTGLDADTVIMTINGEDVTLDFYLYWLIYDCSYWAYMNQIYNGGELDFTQEADEGVTVAEFLRNDAKDVTAYYILTEQQAKANNCELTEEQKNEWLETKNHYIEENGQDGYEEILKQMGVSDTLFERINSVNSLFNNVQDTLAGTPSEDDMYSFSEAQDTYKAKHILICTAEAQEDGSVRLSTGDEILNDDGTPYTGTAEDYNTSAKAKADDILAQINAADDPIAKFDELMQTYSEDTGLATNPDGYTFSSGQMVSEFENAVKNLKFNEYTPEAVQSTYGYHIILRLGVEEEYTQNTMNDLITQWLDEAEIVTTQEYDGLDVADIYEKYNAYQESLNPTEDDTDNSASPSAEPESPSPETESESPSPSESETPSPENGG